MGLAVIDVEVQGPVVGEQLPCPSQPWLQEAEIVAELVVVAQLRQQPRAVAAPPEAGSLALGVGGDRQRPPALRAPRVEGRIHVDEVKCPGRERFQHTEVVAVDDEVGIQLQRFACGLHAHRRRRYTA